MDFNVLLERCLLYFHNNKWAALAVIVASCIFGYLKPKEFFRLLVLALVIGGILYVVSLLGESTTTGIEQKDQMLHKSQEVLQ